MSGSKIAVYSPSDLKNTTDDILPTFLSSLKFKQSHLLSDVRLALGYTAVTLTAAIFLLDRKYGWDKTKDYTLWAVVAYFVLNSALTLWTTFVEKGQVFVGTRDNITISIATRADKFSNTYKVRATYRDSEQSASATTSLDVAAEAPYARWFTRDGFLIAGPLQKWLADEIPPIGQALAASKAAKAAKVGKT